MEITNKLFNIGDFRYFSPVYIESGSCYGSSIDRALKGGFERVKSAEYHAPYYHHCVEKFKGAPVDLFLGKSTDLLPGMLYGEDQCVIFLDAHPAGEGTNSHEEYIKGNEEFYQHNILTKEIELILAHRIDHLIVIDDQVLGSDADSYMEALTLANPNYRYFWYDEQLDPRDPIAKNKILVAIP
jgi:hypothetical protein